MSHSLEAGQSLDPAAKTYTPVRWLPVLRRSGQVRPQTSLRDDAVTIALGFWTLAALFWDGLLHNNQVGQDTFFSPPHIAMYAGLIGLGVWIATVLGRYQDNLLRLDLDAVPLGYGLAIVALPLAALSGPADFIWHSSFGFENQIDSAYSPPHQGLFISGGLLAAIPAASAWSRSERAPSLRNLLPGILSMTSVVAVMLFVIHQLVPFYVGMSTTQDFQDDIAGRAEAFSQGTSDHAEGLARAVTHYGDEAFPYYFFSTHHTVGGILLFTAILVGGVLLMRRRWVVPVGAITVMCTLLGLLFAMLSEYRQAELIPALIVGGIAGDFLLFRLAGEDPPRPGRVRLFAGLFPAILWAAFFLCVALFEGGLGWHATLWVGVLCSSAGLGFAISLLAFPPSSPIDPSQSPPLA